jgi:hypothetical protein
MGTLLATIRRRALASLIPPPRLRLSVRAPDFRKRSQ